MGMIINSHKAQIKLINKINYNLVISKAILGVNHIVKAKTKGEINKIIKKKLFKES